MASVRGDIPGSGPRPSNAPPEVTGATIGMKTPPAPSGGSGGNLMGGGGPAVQHMAGRVGGAAQGYLGVFGNKANLMAGHKAGGL